jgi:hypothetical protein
MTGQRDWRESLVSAAERRHNTPPKRIPLTAGQHILHLLLTIFTFGLWAPVWFIRAWRGNPAPADSR